MDLEKPGYRAAVVFFWLTILVAVGFAAYTFTLRMKAIKADQAGEGVRAGDLRTRAAVTGIAVLVIPAMVFTFIAIARPR